MSENNKRNDITNENSSDSISARAEKIKAIRNAIHNGEESVVPNSYNAGASKKLVKRPVSDLGRAEQNGYGRPPMKNEPQKIAKKTGKKSGKKKKKKKTLGQTFRGFFPEKGDSVLEVIRKFVFMGSIIAIIVCGYMVGDYYLDLWRSRMQYNEIADLYNTYEPIYTTMENEPEDEDYSEKYYTLLTGAQKLIDMNRDVVGYMRIPTKDGDPIVDLPVVQSDNNDKYLHLNFKGEDSRAGALFLDWRNHFDVVENHRLVEKNSENLVVYGHNMADESMFGNLKYYQRIADYYENHSIIQFNSNYETYTYKIFAFFILDALDETETKFDCWNNLNFNSEEDFYNFVNEAKKRTLRTNDVDVVYGDQLLTLSTCNTFLEERGRLIIMARRVRTGEDPYEGTQNSKPNNNIKWPTMYYNSNPNDKYDPDAEFVPYGAKSEKKSSQEDNDDNEDTSKKPKKKSDSSNTEGE